MKILYGTTNQGKAHQLSCYFFAHNINTKLISLKDINFNDEIEENGKTLEENSLIKATAIKQFCDKNNIDDVVIITDDSGLFVDYLNGEPGLYSARYAGVNATQMENINKLLSKLESAPDDMRTASFICALTAILPDGKILTSKGNVTGKIAKEPGTLGKITYGPIFITDGHDKVNNDMPDDVVSNNNHRSRAFDNIIEQLKKEGIFPSEN